MLHTHHHKRLTGLMAGLLLAALMALPAGAAKAQDSGAPQLAGVGEVSVGYVFMDQGSDTDSDNPSDTARYTFGAKVSVPLSDGITFQVDYIIDDDATSDSDNDGNVDQLGLHASWRNNTYLVGAFGAYGRARPEGSSQGDENGLLFGIEGQYYTPNMTFYGQLGVFDGSGNDSEALDSGGFGRLGLRYFLDSNALISGNLLYGAGENRDDDEIDYYSWDVTYRRRIAKTPISWFVGYNGNRFEVNDQTDGTPDEDLTEHIVTVGLTFTFGPSSLKANDRRGATLDIPTTPIRAAGYTVDVVD